MASKIIKHLAPEGEVYAGHKHTENSISFGMATQKVRNRHSSFNYDLFGGSAKVDNKYFSAEGSLNFGHFGWETDIDYTTFVPKIGVKGDANVANFKAEAKYKNHGVENKVFSFESNQFGVNGSFKAGGRSIIPQGSIKNSTASIEGSYKFNDFKLFKGQLYDDSNSSGFNKTVSDREKDIDGFSSLVGNGGKEKGLYSDLYVSGTRRDFLSYEAKMQHFKNDKVLNRIEGKSGFFSNRRNELIADKSSEIIDRLNGAIDAAKAEKDKVDKEILSNKLNPKKEGKAFEKSSQLRDEIDSLTKLRDDVVSDRNRALSNLGHCFDNCMERKDTSQIIADAKKNSDTFEDALKKNMAENGKVKLDKDLASPTVDVCRSKNELNGRINELDRRINDRKRDLDRLEEARNNYLQRDKGELKANNGVDPYIEKLNKDEMGIRSQMAECRKEKGECQKALLETDKNFMPREQSAEFEKKGRDLEAEKIDNNLAQETKKDDIANYCNRNGLERPLDKDGNYLKSDDVKDEGLKNLLDEQAALEKEGKAIDNNIVENDKSLAQSERDGKTSAKITEKNGNASLNIEKDDYGMHRETNPKLRGDKALDEDKEKDKDAKDNVKGESHESKKNGDEHARSEPQKDKDSGMSTTNPAKDGTKPEKEKPEGMTTQNPGKETPAPDKNKNEGMSTSNPTKDGTKPEKEKPEGMTTQNPGKETPAPDKNKNEGMSTSNPTKDGTKPEKEKPEGMTTQNPGKETPAPDKNVNEGMPSASKGKEAPKPEKEKSEGMPSANKGEDAPKPEKEKSGGMPTSAPGGSDSKPEKEKSGGMSTTAPGSSGEKAPSPPEKSKNSGMQM